LDAQACGAIGFGGKQFFGGVEEGNMSSDQTEKFDLRSHDVAEDKRQELLRLFPEIRTEGDKLDFDRLRLALGESVDVGKERYATNWPGKADCFKAIQTPTLAALRPCPQESVNFNTTENLIIEGDNLEVLKLLQKPYLGKIKMIYIDPPYNTGNDFIYPDNYTESLQTYLEYTGQVDSEGRRFGTNTEADGRFHSKWLNMMYPRLYLARNLLREDGVIFVTIDDTEESNLRKMCDDIFGEENFVANVAWQKKYAVSNNYKGVASVRDFVLIYAKSDAFQNGLLPRSEEARERYQNPDNDRRGPWKPVDYWNIASPEDRPNLVYPITNPNTGKIILPEKKAWKYSKDVHERHIKENRIWWGSDGGNSVPALKLFLSEVRDGLIPHNWWPHEEAGHTDEAKKQLDHLFDGNSPFDTPKPVRLITRMCQVGAVSQSDIVLDFFAGSGTTAHAVLNMNEEDGAARTFILVQLPEPTQRKDYPTIADITKERVRRVIKKLNDEDSGKLDLESKDKKDRGFRVLKLAESNFKPWDAGVPHDAPALGRQLELHVSHILEGRTDQDILYEILLKSGYPLTTPVETVALAGKTVHSVAGGQLLICLERKLTLELIRAMAERQPERVVCLDEGFAGNDQLKTNAAHIFEPTDRREAKSDAKRFRTV
jgi:adenine-specific DNA-methyltransferase